VVTGGWGRGGKTKDEGRGMNEENWCICFVVLIYKVSFRLLDSHFILPEWGRVDINLNSFYTNNAFDKLHYHKHKSKQDFA
jgi:hypothetical protein